MLTRRSIRPLRKASSGVPHSYLYHCALPPQQVYMRWSRRMVNARVHYRLELRILHGICVYFNSTWFYISTGSLLHHILSRKFNWWVLYKDETGLDWFIREVGDILSYPTSGNLTSLIYTWSRWYIILHLEISLETQNSCQYITKIFIKTEFSLPNNGELFLYCVLCGGIRGHIIEFLCYTRFLAHYAPLWNTITYKVFAYAVYYVLVIYNSYYSICCSYFHICICYGGGDSWYTTKT